MEGMAIWKFTLRGENEQRIEMPAGARILTAAIQHLAPQVWAVVDPDRPRIERTFYIVATGADVPDGADYVSTVMMGGGDYAFHIFAALEARVAAQQAQFIQALAALTPFADYAAWTDDGTGRVTRNANRPLTTRDITRAADALAQIAAQRGEHPAAPDAHGAEEDAG